MSETLRLGFLLAVTGGFLESYTFLCRGGVFANCQTGNLVLLALNLSWRNWEEVLYYLAPVAAFVVGVMLTETIKKAFFFHPRLHWRQVVILIEAFVLFLAGLIPCGPLDVIVTVLISFICSMQADSFRKLHGSPFSTTMCTGNLRSASENLFAFLFRKEKEGKDKSVRYFAVVFSFMAGAVGGAVFTNLFRERAVLFCCAALMTAFFLMFIREDSKEHSQASQ